jgi:hypothetical protein
VATHRVPGGSQMSVGMVAPSQSAVVVVASALQGRGRCFGWASAGPKAVGSWARMATGDWAIVVGEKEDRVGLHLV